MSRARTWAPVLLWSLGLFCLSSLPGSSFPSVSVPSADKLVHLALYSVLGALCARALRRSSRLRGAPAILVAAAVATLYGASDEIHQLFVRGRSAELADVAADGVGGLLGAAAFAVVFRQGRT